MAQILLEKPRSLQELPGGNAGQLSFAVLALLGAWWILPLWGLSLHWSINPQYHYGWFVPFLALIAAVNRWKSRPEPGLPQAVGLWLAAAAAALMAPTWLFSQPNPDWVLVNWLFVTEAAAMTLGALVWTGGWSWAAYFFAPIALIFTAIPWPDQLEAPATQSLMRTVAALAVSVLDLLGISALQHGNLIEVASGTVGVDEACSGIRSLQGSLMASFFLGELYRLSLGRRAALVGFSLAAALVTNVMRATFLAAHAARSGLEAVHRWHDPAGWTIFAVCLALILVAARWLDRGSTPVPASPVRPATPLPGRFAVVLAIWLGITVLGAEAWYYDPAPAPESPWHLAPPAESDSLPVPVAVTNAFHASDSMAAAWRGPGGSQWLLYYFEWKFGPAFSRVAASMHHPDICLPAQGRTLQEARGILTFRAGGRDLPFQGYVFLQGDQPLYVYHGIWQFRSARGLSHGALAAYKQAAAVESVLWRDREIGQQAAEFIAIGCHTAEQADAALAGMLPGMLINHSPAAQPSAAGSRQNQPSDP